MRRPLLEAIAIAALSVLVGFAINAARREPLPMRIPPAFFRVESSAKPIFLEAARRLFDEGQAVFVDARPAAAYRSGQIEGACNVPYDRWQEVYPELASWIEGRKLVVYAGAGEIERADDLALALANQGVSDSLFLYLGGIEEWTATGLPVRAGPDPLLDDEPGAAEEGNPAADPGVEEPAPPEEPR